jgi:hypothetical protein
MGQKDKYFYDASYTQRFRAEYGDTYRGRKIIGRDMDVRGGVFYGKFRESSEAIVVDPDNHPDIYWDYFKSACDRARDESGEVVGSSVLGAVFDTVRANMRYSKKGVSYVRRELGPADGQKIELGVFMDAGVGVCRHQALACAALLEDFKDAGYIHGHVSIDRSHRWDPDNDKDRGGHAWVRYTTEDDNAYILDVAQNYFGPAEEGTEEARWNYLRPEEESERRVMTRQRLGRAALGRARNYLRRITKRE